jgi:8-oxo-dGTP pyrophosphatase MutT (NUDIX family)
MIISASTLALIRTKRCGVLPYTRHNDKFWFMLGRHADTQDLCDFGGGVKKDETALDAGLREFHEETRDIFTGFSFDVKNCASFINRQGTMAIIFLYIAEEWFYRAPTEFQKIIPLYKKHREICDVVWVHEKAMKNMLWGYKKSTDVVWSRIRVFFSYFSAVSFFETLKRSVKIVTSETGS